MGLFWKRSTASNLGDRVWMTKELKNRHLVAESESFIVSEKLVFVASYFQNSEIAITSILEETNIDYIRVHDAISSNPSKINVIKANTLLSEIFTDRLVQSNHEIIVLFAEHYPLFEKENSIISSMGMLGKKCSYCFYLAFDEPVLQKFGAEKILALLSQLGIKEDEVISHPLISKAVVNIQKKIESEITNELSASSMEEWFERNISNTSLV